MDERVIVTSMANGQVSIILPHLRFKKTWMKKGTKLPVPKDILREAIYEPGVERMFQEGILVIEDDMAFKIELGLEEEGTQTPTKVIVMDEKYMNRLLRFMLPNDMKKELAKLGSSQREEFIDYVTNQNNIDFSKIEIINEVCGVNLLKIIELKKQKEE